MSSSARSNVFSFLFSLGAFARINSTTYQKLDEYLTTKICQTLLMYKNSIGEESVIVQTPVSFVLKLLRYPFAIVDILPILAGIYISFVFSATLLSLIAPELSNLMTNIGFEKGLLGLQENSVSNLGIDFRNVNFTSFVTAILLLPTVLLVSLRETTSTPPRSYFQFYWTILIGSFALIVWNDATKTGQELIKGTNYDSIADVIHNMGGIGNQIGTENRFSMGMAMLSMAFYVGTFTYFFLAVVSIFFFVTRKLPLYTRQVTRSRSISIVIAEIVRSVKFKDLLIILIKTVFSVVLINMILLSDQLLSVFDFQRKITEIIVQYNHYLTDKNQGFFGMLVQIPNFLTLAVVIYFITNLLVFNFEPIKVFCLRLVSFFITLIAAIFFAVNNSPIFAYTFLAVSMFGIAFLPAIVFLRGMFTIFVKFIALISIKLIKRTRIDEKPILLLRPFSLDNAKLKVRRPLMHTLLPFFSSTGSLEEVISRAAYRKGPLLAVGKPGEKNQPLGAIREYFSDTEWQPFVKETVNSAYRVVLICGATKYTRWETEQIISFGALERTIFVIPTDPSTAVKYFIDNPEIAQFFDLQDDWISVLEKGHVRCLYRISGKTLIVKNRFSTIRDYQLALDCAFSSQ